MNDVKALVENRADEILLAAYHPILNHSLTMTESRTKSPSIATLTRNLATASTVTLSLIRMPLPSLLSVLTSPLPLSSLSKFNLTGLTSVQSIFVLRISLPRMSWSSSAYLTFVHPRKALLSSGRFAQESPARSRHDDDSCDACLRQHLAGISARVGQESRRRHLRRQRAVGQAHRVQRKNGGGWRRIGLCGYGVVDVRSGEWRAGDNGKAGTSSDALGGADEGYRCVALGE